MSFILYFLDFYIGLLGKAGDERDKISRPISHHLIYE